MDAVAIKTLLERHWSNVGNQAIVHEIYHDDVVLELPQGGEQLTGLANVRAMREAYPADVTITIQRVRGRDELWITEVEITYDGKTSMNAVNIMEFRGEKVARETIYFGEPWQPPAWRHAWIEPFSFSTNGLSPAHEQSK